MNKVVCIVSRWESINALRWSQAKMTTTWIEVELHASGRERERGRETVPSRPLDESGFRLLCSWRVMSHALLQLANLFRFFFCIVESFVASKEMRSNEKKENEYESLAKLFGTNPFYGIPSTEN